jgi:hypothetical protein
VSEYSLKIKSSECYEISAALNGIKMASDMIEIYECARRCLKHNTNKDQALQQIIELSAEWRDLLE